MNADKTHMLVKEAHTNGSWQLFPAAANPANDPPVEEAIRAPGLVILRQFKSTF